MTEARSPGRRSSDVAAVNGSDVHLTIDADLQWYAQNAIADQVAKTGAVSGSIIVMEAKTGKLRAVASSPTFDPTNFAKATPSQLRSPAFQDVYEPGSTVKVLSFAAALEEKLITPSTGVIVPNRLRRGDTTFKDYVDHPTQELTATGVLAKSSNIGTILATEAVPPSTIEKYYRAFGLGAKPGTGFPGEPSGLVTPAAALSGSQRYTELYGQGISVSTLQMTSVFQTIANGGVRVTPRLIDSIDGPQGLVTPAIPEPTRVFSPDTAKDLSAMLEAVVGPGGTGSRISVPGYRLAGKSGTAYRYDDALRDYNGYTLSFIGYAPAEDPEFVVAVVLQKPALSNPSSSGLCGPLFASVMNYALQSYRIAPSGAPAPGFPVLISGLPGGTASVVIRDSRASG
ncbi:MAG: penicillin-binding protein 2 [Dermatophilaceae bacterium]